MKPDILPLSQARGEIDPINYERSFMLRESVAILNATLETLPPRLQFVLRMYYGIGANEEHTLQAIGDQLGLCKERVRELKLYARIKLIKRLRLRLRLTGYRAPWVP